MADRWAVANGDWSNTATWNGGTLPAATDDVYADGYTVTIDQTITAVSINTTQRSGGTAGGGFTFTDGYTINANINAGTTTCVTINTGGTFAVNGDITGGSTNGAHGFHSDTYSISPAPTLNVTINGNLNGGSVSTCYGYYVSGNNHTITITGNITGGSATYCAGFQVSYSTSTELNNLNITINGNITGGSSTCHGASIYSSASSFVLNGNVTGGTANYSHGLYLNMPSSYPEINGNSYAGSANYTYGIYVTATELTVTGNIENSTSHQAGGLFNGHATVNIIGNVLGGSSNGRTYGIWTHGGVINVTGNVTAGPATEGYGINCSYSPTINITGNVSGGGYRAYGLAYADATVVINGDISSGSAGESYALRISGSSSNTYVNGTCRPVGSYAVYNLGSAGTILRIKRLEGSSSITPSVYSAYTPTEIEYFKFGNTIGVPLYGYFTFKDTTTNQIDVYKTGASTATTMIDPAASGDYPVTGDVRSGTVYNYNAFTGTLAVPLASQVAAGVAVDNTVGTAILTEAGLTSILQSVLSFSSSSSVERSPDDTKAISFTWPTAGATLVGTVSIDGGSFTGVAGTVSFLYTDGAGKNWYTLSYNSADRPSSEGVARYVFSDGTYTRSYSLRVEGKVDVSALALESSMQTAISGVNDIPPLITNVVNVSTMEAF